MYCLFKGKTHLKSLLTTDHNFVLPLLLMLFIGSAYIGVLCLFSPPNKGQTLDLSAHRFNDLPVDNVLPVIFADCLENGKRPKHLFGEERNDWLGSDRPPLQTGVILMIRPLLHFSKLGVSYTGFTASLWFQLFWIPAVWSLLRGFGASTKQSVAVIAITACTGFALLYSLYTWPKFGAAALLLGGISILLAGRSPHSTFRWTFVAVMLALAHLSHGGSDFGLLGLLIILFVPTLRPSLKEAVLTLIVFVAVSTPWMAYQKFYDPPGNRLLKMHLAGVNDVDNRGFLETLIDQYRAVGWSGAWQNKRANFSRLIEGDLKQIFSFDSDRVAARTRRDEEFFFFSRAMGFGNFAIALLPVAIFCFVRRANDAHIMAPKLLIGLGWAALTLVIWCLLMFAPGSSVLHQGSLAPILFVFSIAMFLTARCSRLIFWGISALQLISFIATWIPANPSVQNALDPVACALIILCMGALAWIATVVHDIPLNSYTK